MEKYDFRLPRDTFALITDYHNYTAKKGKLREMSSKVWKIQRSSKYIY